MPTSTATTRTNGRVVAETTRSAISRGPEVRRRQLPLVVVGVLLVLGCALAFADASLHMGSREEVLVVAQPISAGQMLTTADLQSAQVSTGSGVQVVPASEEASVVGRSVAVPLVPGALLTRTEVGSSSAVGSDSDVVAVGLKSGAYPPDLAPGDRVQVIPVSSSSSGSGSESWYRRRDQWHSGLRDRVGGAGRHVRIRQSDGLLAPGLQGRRRRGGCARRRGSGQPHPGRIWQLT